MKKKSIFTFLLGIVCAVCGAVGFTACAPQPQEEEILLASFESYEELIRYHYLNYFGSAKPSKEYVTEGKGGAEGCQGSGKGSCKKGCGSGRRPQGALHL